MPSRHAGHARLAFAVLLVALAALFAGARCYPADTRVIVFIQGVYTTYGSDGTQGTGVEAHRFDALKAAFLAKGYEDGALLDFSYEGGAIAGDGAWLPAPYRCSDTDRAPGEHLAVLEDMLRRYREEHPRAHFALVGHSLGGYLAYLEGAREAARPEDERLAIDVVVTLDAPISGVSADKKIVLDLVNCEKTYAAGADLAAVRLDPATPDLRRLQSVLMAQQGIRLGTYGNLGDCLFALPLCIGGDWADDTETQFLDGLAAVSIRYDIRSELLFSHDAILADPAVVNDVVTFVGAP